MVMLWLRENKDAVQVACLLTFAGSTGLGFFCKHDNRVLEMNIQIPCLMREW